MDFPPEVDSAELPVIDIKIFFDPAIKSNYKQALSGAVEKIAANVQTEWVLDELQQQLSEGKEEAPKKLPLMLAKIMRVDQRFASENKYQGLMLNSVQHNVPAWTMFAMFFILYPLAGNFIKEREEGSMLRLRLISGSQWPVISGKFGFYFMICLVQFLLMIAVGIYIMPLLGLDQACFGKQSTWYSDYGMFCSDGSHRIRRFNCGIFPNCSASLVIWICFGCYSFRHRRRLGTGICYAGNFTDRQPIFSHELGVRIF